jgi:uncharacterized SAM-binding protein YcdF (DUF218 family)
VSVLKHLTGLVAKPLLMALLIGLGAAAASVRQHRRVAWVLLCAFAAVIYVAAAPPVAEVLLRSLERQYSAWPEDQALPNVAYVVVLGSDYQPRSAASITGALDDDGLARIVEGILLLRRLPGAHLLVSGGASAPHVPSAIGYARLARDFGVDGTALVLLSEPMDTAAEARAVASHIGDAPFLLVTSAYHMPRAMRLMLRAGTRPLPVPVGQRAGKWSGSMIPGAAALGSTERVLHEYLGLAAIALGVD